MDFIMTDKKACSMEVAAEKGGFALDEMGKTDLASLSRDEWMHFIFTVCSAYELEEEIPF